MFQLEKRINKFMKKQQWRRWETSFFDGGFRRYTATWTTGPKENQVVHEVDSWESLYEYRRFNAKKHADTRKDCACWCCRNSRYEFKICTKSEVISHLNALNECDDLGIRPPKFRWRYSGWC